MESSTSVYYGLIEIFGYSCEHRFLKLSRSHILLKVKFCTRFTVFRTESRVLSLYALFFRLSFGMKSKKHQKCWLSISLKIKSWSLSLRNIFVWHIFEVIGRSQFFFFNFLINTTSRQINTFPKCAISSTFRSLLIIGVLSKQSGRTVVMHFQKLGDNGLYFSFTATKYQCNENMEGRIYFLKEQRRQI